MQGNEAISVPTWALKIVKQIDSLSKAQKVALSRICVGDDSCLNPKTAKELRDRGLISYELVDMGEGLRLYRADVSSYAVHYAWCVWCATQPESFDE